MSNFAQIAYKGVSLAVEVEEPQAPATPSGGQMYLNPGDFVPYFKFNALPDGEADAYETGAWKSTAPGTILTEETAADLVTIESGVKKVYRVYAVSGTGLGTITPGTTVYVRARARLGDLYSDWTETYSVLYTY